MISVHTTAYSRTQTSIYVSDKMRTFLKLLVNHYGLDPQGVVDAWTGWVDRAARIWLESGDLLSIVIEFHRPNADKASARWDFPIRYDGNDVDEMWIDRDFFQDGISKSSAPPAGSIYRILLTTRDGRPNVPGVGPTTFLSTNGLTAREAGTIIATPDLMASARYYR